MNIKNLSEKSISLLYLFCQITTTILVVVSFLQCIFDRISSLTIGYIRDVSFGLCGIILCSILMYSLVNNKPWDKQNRSLVRLVFTMVLLFHFDIVSCFSEGRANHTIPILLINTFQYFWETQLVYCFWTYIRREVNIRIQQLFLLHAVCLTALYTDLLIDLLNMKFGFYFSVTASGNIIYGPYDNFSKITTFVIYVIIWYVILQDRICPLKKKLILLSFLIFPTIALILSIIFNDSFIVFPSYLFSVMLIYINVFAVKSKTVLEQKVILDEQKTALMISQIQPHFLYNVLTTISNLCITDPEEAEETTVLFSQYLRTNLDSLRNSEPVPFQTELGHIQTYIALEKKRFGDKIQVEIHCPEVDFPVPVLGLQPIVENSIKHGIRGKDTPGHILISSSRVDDGYEVIIEDDGVGFDLNAPLPDDGKSHVGMKNVKERLELMCQAKVQVESSPGNGCKTTIFFPEN